MAAAVAAENSLRIISFIRVAAATIASFLPRLRGMGAAALCDLGVSLIFLRCGLRPRRVDVGSGDTAASVHVWVPVRRRSGRPAVALVHGFGADGKWQWMKQITRLAGSFDVFVPDLVFFGRSESCSPHRSLRFQAYCMGEVMRILGVGSYSVCGISYGGFIAYHMAAELKAVNRVVFLSAGVCTSEVERKAQVDDKHHIMKIFLPRSIEDLKTLLRLSFYQPPEWLPAFLLRDFIEAIGKEHHKERGELLEELLCNGVGLNPIPILKQETLILWGNQDKVFPLHLASQLLRHLGERAKLEIIPDAGHALQLEKPDLVNRCIEYFLLNSTS